MPVGSGVHPGPGVDLWRVTGQVGLDGDAQVTHRIVDPGQQLKTGRSPGHACVKRSGPRGGSVSFRIRTTRFSRGQVHLGIHVPSVGRRHPVHGRQKIEVRHSAAVPQHPTGLDPRLGGDPNPDVHARFNVALDQAAAQGVGQRSDQRVALLVNRDLHDSIDLGFGCRRSIR